MNLRPRKGQDIEVNITPLIDVVFLLLIFFMITTSFQHDSPIRIDPPDSPEEPKGNKTKQVEVWVDKEGNFYVDKEQVDARISSIAEAIRASAEQKKGAPLMICADADSSHEHVIKAMSAATKVGFAAASICTKRPEQ